MGESKTTPPFFMFHHLVFDLDGTLLETLPDIRLAINRALKDLGYAHQFSLAESKKLIDDGADMLVHRALKEFDTPEAFAALKEKYMPYYAEMQNDHAKPFNGLPPVLSFLSTRGIKLYVVTNKPDALAQKVVTYHYGNLFEAILGIQEGTKVKPDPSLVNRLVSRYEIDKGDLLLIGDSHVDIETAENAGIQCCLVTWGYDFYKPALLERADYVCKRPKELARIALGQEGW